MREASIRVGVCAAIVAVASLASGARAEAQCSYEAPMTPLIDLTGAYQGESGGLYGGGSNTPPPELSTEGRRRALDVTPIDGAIVMVSVGMSNTTQEFSNFVPLAMGHPDVNPALVVVDGAQGSEPAPAWTDPTAATWRELDRRLSRAGVRPEQVQIAWVKQAVPNPRGGFPAHAETLQGHLEDIARALRTNYPNIRLAFFSSRTRACTERSLNPEPYAYESAFSVRWMIEAQQAGDTSLDPDSRAPLLAWGPYLWAKATPRSDGFSWPCTSVRTDDCTHPSESGQMRVADLLLEFFTTDPLATPWFLRPSAVPPFDAGAPPSDAGTGPDSGAPDAASGLPDGGESDAGEAEAGPPDTSIAPPDGGEGSGGCAIVADHRRGTSLGFLVWGGLVSALVWRRRR